MARPLRLLSMRRRPVQHDHDDQAVVVEPLVFAERQAERHLGLVEHDALHAAGQALEPLVFQDLRHRQRQRKGGERQVVALELERRQAEQVADDEADDGRARQRRPIRHVQMVHQHGRGVGADGVERAVAQRDLAVEAGQQVEPQHGDGGNDHRADEKQPIVGDHVGKERVQKRHHEGQRQQDPQPCLRKGRHVRPSSRRRGRTGRPASRSGRRSR
jgi:hypothetical protein